MFCVNPDENNLAEILEVSMEQHQLKNKRIGGSKSTASCLRLLAFFLSCSLAGIFVLCVGVIYFQLEFLVQLMQLSSHSL